MITLDGITFDKKVGVILLPEPNVIPFRSASAEGVGLQVTSDRSPASSLTLTAYYDDQAAIAFRNTLEGKIGTVVDIVEYFNNVAHNYRTSHGKSFAVSHARIIENNVIPHWGGYRIGVYHSHTPAVKIVSQWTLYAVDAT